MKTFRSVFHLPLLMGLFAMHHALATVIVVDNLNASGPGSYQAALEQAQSRDTIRIDIAGTIPVDSQYILVDTLTIIGLGPDVSILDAQDSTQFFDIQAEGNLTLLNLTVARGNAQKFPLLRSGGVALLKGTVFAENCVFRENVGIAGGAFFLEGSGNTPRATFINCSFYENGAVLPSPLGLFQSGGAIFIDGLAGGDARVAATNCTFSGNRALRSGGAIYAASRGEGTAIFSCTNCTITDNEAVGRFGGGIDNSEANGVSLANSIVSGNRAPEEADLFGTLSSGGHNVLGDGTLYTPAATDIIALDPLLGPLGDHGSPLFTHVPRCASPAVDAGDAAVAPTLDLRGRGRVGLPDIGAHERDEAVDGKVLNLLDTGANSIREALLLACPGDTILLNQISGFIPLTAPLVIDQPISLWGNPDVSVAISGEDSVRIVEILPGGNLFAQDITFRRGFAASFGGGAFLNRGELSLSRCAVILSRAEAGGGIANYGNQDTARLTLTNCTLSGNEATAFAGGGIDNRGLEFGAYASLINCTVTDNTSLFQGGGVFNDGASFGRCEIANTLIAENNAEEGPDGFGDIRSLGHNLVGVTENINLTAQVGDQLDVSAELDILFSWGGVTPTHRLDPNSPAVDAGDNSLATAVDQRGFVRVFNQTIDIGAYEYDPGTTLPNSKLLSNEVEVFPNPSRGPYTIRISSAYTGPMDVSLHAVTGTTVLTQRIDFQDGEAHLPSNFSLHQLPAGVYSLRLYNGVASFSTNLFLR